MGRARQIASSENMDRIILDSSDGTVMLVTFSF